MSNLGAISLSYGENMLEQLSMSIRGCGNTEVGNGGVVPGLAILDLECDFTLDHIVIRRSNGVFSYRLSRKKKLVVPYNTFK